MKPSTYLEKGLRIKISENISTKIDEQGNDMTKCFSSENELFSSETLRTGNASTFSIECIEDCQCIKLPYTLVLEIMEEDKGVKDFFTQYCLCEIEKLEKRTRDLALMNAKERYIEFCKQYPHLHEWGKLKYIASYIGFRAASLSRIRRELNFNV
jgi:CRP-like cAMP-binding protein